MLVQSTKSTTTDIFGFFWVYLPFLVTWYKFKEYLPILVFANTNVTMQNLKVFVNNS